MLSNQKSSRFKSFRAIGFLAIALALLMNVTAFASGNSRFAFIDTAAEFFGLQSNASVATTTEPAKSSEIRITTPFGTATASLPNVVSSSGPGLVSVPITVSDLSALAVISYDFNVDYDDTILTPAVPPVTQTGTLSASMSVTPNVGFSGHLIISAFQAVPVGAGTTLLILNFNKTGTAGTSPLNFADYTDPGPAFHEAFVFNEGTPADVTTNGSIQVPAGPTATSTNTDTPTPSATNTFTPSNTSTPTNTPSETSTATNTSTPTPTPLCAQIDIEDEVTTNGSSVTISVSTSDTNVLSPPAISADFRISYDNTVLSGVPTSPYGVTLGPVGLSNSSSLTVNRQISGSTTTLLISLYTGDTLPFNGSGDLVTITFPTVTGAPGLFSPIVFTGWPQVPAGFWYNEGFPSVCLADGSVQILGTVSGRILYDHDIFGPPAIRPVPNTTLNVTGSGFPAVASVLTNANGDYTLSGFGSGVYNVSPFRDGILVLPDTHGAAISAYDAAITAQRVVELIPFTAKQNFVANVTQTGQVSSNDSAKMAQWAVGLTGPAPNFTGDWRFSPTFKTYTSAATYTAENYLAYLLGDPSGNWCDPTSTGMGAFCSPAGTAIGSPRPANGPTRATEVRASNVTAPAGSDIAIPVSVQGVANKGIISYQFDLHYDAAVIQPTANAVTLGDASSGMSVVFNPAAPGVLRVAVYGPYALVNSGTMLNFHFTAVGEVLSSSSLTFENFMFNEGGITTNLIAGEVRLSAAVPNTAAE